MTWLKLDTSKHPLSWVVKLSQRAIDYPALHNGSQLAGLILSPKRNGPKARPKRRAASLPGVRKALRR